MAKNKKRNKGSNGSEQGKYNPDKNRDSKQKQKASTHESKVTEKTDQTNKEVVEKVNSQMAKDSDTRLARFIGMAIIILGVVILLMVLAAAFLANRDPRVDKGLTVPTVKVEEYVDSKDFDVRGQTDPDTEVEIRVQSDFDSSKDEYQNTETYSVEVDGDGEFVAEVSVDEEGEYAVSAATIKGFPIKSISEFSEPVVVTVDTTAPSANVELNYPDTAKSGFTLSGTVDPDTEVILEGEDTTYIDISDDEGAFAIENIDMGDKEESEFTVVLRDKAGNERELNEKVVVRNTAVTGQEGDLNGDGVTTGPDLPEASGPLEDGLAAVASNQLIVLMGLAALGIFAVNSGVVAFVANRKER